MMIDTIMVMPSAAQIIPSPSQLHTKLMGGDGSPARQAVRALLNRRAVKPVHPNTDPGHWRIHRCYNPGHGKPIGAVK